jgi:branched-subunit amino acid aminotransferase/4-amino-4-deoxychorismate lyase
MDPEPLFYFINGLRPQRDAALPLTDPGVRMGVNVSEVCRTFRHRLFRLADHLDRFRQSCDLAYIPQPRSHDELAAVAENLVARNGPLIAPASEMVLVMFATPDTFCMYTAPLPFARDAHLFRDGARLVTPQTRHVPRQSLDPRIKHRNRLHWWVAQHQVDAQSPGAIALLLDADGCVTEIATANLLIVRDGVVLSPPRSTILNGISLLVTEEICRDLGIPFREQPLPLAECLTADEAFLTSTPFCIAGVRELNGVGFPWPGPVFRRLQTAWNERAGLDIAAQFLAAT